MKLTKEVLLETISEILEEEWSKSERDKRKSKCANPKGFTMKQFCKNQKTRSKKGEKIWILKSVVKKVTKLTQLKKQKKCLEKHIVIV
jgi:hypothetical protein